MLGTHNISELHSSPSLLPSRTHSSGSSIAGVLALPQTYISTLGFHHKLLSFAVVVPWAWDILPSDSWLLTLSTLHMNTPSTETCRNARPPSSGQYPLARHYLMLCFSCCCCTAHLLVYYIISFSHRCCLNLPLSGMLHKGRDLSLASFGFWFSLLDPNA